MPRPKKCTKLTLEPTDLAAVDARLARAKERIASAALACIRGRFDHPELVRQALLEVERARSLLQRSVTVIES